MHTKRAWLLALTGLLAAGCNTQSPAPSTPAPAASAPAAAAPAAATAAAVGKIDRLDPALDSIIAPGAAIEKVADGFKFTEGPLWRPDHTLWFSDVVGNVMRSVTPDGKVTVLIEDAGGKSTAPAGSF